MTNIKFPVPKTQKQLPQSELLCGKAFQWNAHAQKAFENIKAKFCSAPCLVHSNHENPFILPWDASLHGVVALNIEVHPEIDLASDAFRSGDYSTLRKKHSSLKLHDYQVVNDCIYHRAFPNSIDTSPDDCWKLFVPESKRHLCRP